MNLFFVLLVCIASTCIAMDCGEAYDLCDGYKPTTRRTAVIGCRNTFPIEVTLEQGKAVFEYAQTLFTRDALAASMELEDFRLPRGFWQAFFPKFVHRSSSRSLEQMYRKAFRFYLAALKKGAVTACGMMG